MPLLTVLLYSGLVQVVKAKTAQGFVPNGYAPTRKSTHSQPPVGSKVLCSRCILSVAST